MYYTFEGTVTGFESFHNAYDIDDFDVVIGETKVAYLFEIDFDSNTSAHTNIYGATWSYFYTELLSGSIINGVDRPSFYRGFNISTGLGQITGSKLEVRVQTDRIRTNDWRVQDWKVGQTFSSIDSGCFAGGVGGCAVYAFGKVELTKISNSMSPTLPVDEPSPLALLALGLWGLYFSSRRVQ